MLVVNSYENTCNVESSSVSVDLGESSLSEGEKVFPEKSLLNVFKTILENFGYQLIFKKKSWSCIYPLNFFFQIPGRVIANA